MANTAPKWLSEMLQKDSFLHYHSYFKGVRHNHKNHGVVALYRLGGSQQRIQKYLDAMYIVPVYNPEEELKEVLEIDYLKSDKLEDYRGKNQAFYTMLNMYDKVFKSKYNNNIMAMIKGECPAILDGPLYSAFHGLIQIAYGLVGNNDLAMLEGIVFMDQQYSPMYMDQLYSPKRKDLTKFGHGKTNLLDILKKLREDTDLLKTMNEQNRNDLQLRKDTHMYGIYGWSGPKYHSDLFMDLTDDLLFPEWFDASKKDMDQLKRVIDWFCDMATVLYVESNTINDFFLLHGITAGWSAKQVLPLFDYDIALLGLRSMFSAIYVTYMTQGAPALSRKPEDFYKGQITQAVWDEFIKTTLNSKDYETHVYKVMQCLYEFWKERKDSGYAQYYLAGAYAVRDHPYGRGPTATSPNDDLSM